MTKNWMLGAFIFFWFSRNVNAVVFAAASTYHFLEVKNLNYNNKFKVNNFHIIIWFKVRREQRMVWPMLSRHASCYHKMNSTGKHFSTIYSFSSKYPSSFPSFFFVWIFLLTLCESYLMKFSLVLGSILMWWCQLGPLFSWMYSFMCNSQCVTHICLLHVS